MRTTMICFVYFLNIAFVFAQIPPGIVGGLHERSVAASDFEVLLHPPEQTGDEAKEGVEGKRIVLLSRPFTPQMPFIMLQKLSQKLCV
jgi:hypothetical protein